MEDKRPSRRKVQLLIGTIAVLMIAGTTATALTPRLATKDPLLLILLDARNRNLVLARRVDVVPFVLVGTLRRVLSDPLFWLLGLWYGDKAIRWLDEKAGGGVLVQLTEKVFAKAAYPMVFCFPGAIVCALAGATGMPFPAFLAVNLAGTVTAVVALRLAGDVLSGPVDALLGFFERNMVPSMVGFIVLAVLSVVLNRAQGRMEIPSVEELEGEEGEAEDGTATTATASEREPEGGD